MKRKAPLCNGAVCGKLLSYFWPLWVLYAWARFLTLPAPLVKILLQEDHAFLTLRVLSSLIGREALLPFLFGGLTAMAVFSCIYNTRSTNFVCALPIRRETLYLSDAAVGLLGLWGAELVTFLCTVLLEAVYRQLDMVTLLTWLQGALCMDLTFFGAAAFCAPLTGHILVLPAVYAILQFTAVTAETTVRHLLQYTVFGMGPVGWQDLSLPMLSPAYYLISQHQRMELLEESYDPVTYRLTGAALTGEGTLLLYAGAGLLLLLAGLFLFRKRKMEAAEDVVAVSGLKPVFRWCLALASALGFAACVMALAFSGTENAGLREAIVLLTTMLVGGFAGWFAADMLMYKTLWVFRRHWKGWLLFSAILTALTLGAVLDVTGFQHRLPQKERVSSVQLRSSAGDVLLQEPENIQAAIDLQESIVSHKVIHCENHRGAMTPLRIRYYTQDEDGEERLLMERYYRLSTILSQTNDPASDVSRCQELLNVQEAIFFRKHIEGEITPATVRYGDVFKTGAPGSGEEQHLSLTPEETYELYRECIVPDIAEGTLGRVWLITGEEYVRTVTDVSIQIGFVTPQVDGEEDYYYEYFSTVPTADFWRTNRWLEEHGLRPDTLWNSGVSAGQYAPPPM